MTEQQVPAAAHLRAESLRGLCGGAVHLPGDPSYDLARSPWNLQMSDFPAAVAYPAFPDEVADVLRTATAAGLSVAPQGTGHGAPPLHGNLTEAVLLGNVSYRVGKPLTWDPKNLKTNEADAEKFLRTEYLKGW